MDKVELLNNFSNYLRDEGSSKNTITTYVRNLKMFLEYYQNGNNKVLNQLRREDILNYKEYLEKTDIAATTYNNKLSSIMAFNKFLIKDKIQDAIVIISNDFKTMQQSEFSPTDICKKEVDKFLNKIETNECKRNYAIVVFMAYAGLRISEVLNIKLRDIKKIEEYEMKILGKGNKVRDIFINDIIKKAVEDYLKERKSDSEYLFVSNRNDNLNRSTINIMFNKYSKKITPHKLRHFFATYALVDHGMNIKVVADQLGHSNIQTTMIYLNPTKSYMKNQFKSFK